MAAWEQGHESRQNTGGNRNFVVVMVPSLCQVSIGTESYHFRRYAKCFFLASIIAQVDHKSHSASFLEPQQLQGKNLCTEKGYCLQRPH